MSYWIGAYCHRSVLPLTAKDLILGISERLEPLVYQFPSDRPEENTDEAIETALKRLKILPASNNKPFRHHALSYLKDGPPITTVFYSEEDTPGIIEAEVLPGRLARLRRPEARRVRELLRDATQSVAFSLKVVHHTGIGFPLALAAAVTLVDYADGIICAGGCSWMVPQGEFVDIILEYDE
jgi:hypothetical protein